MNMTFQAFDTSTGGNFDWTITDDKITYKGKTILLDSLILIKYAEPEIASANGIFTFYFGKGAFGNVTLTFQSADTSRAKEVADFLLNYIGEDRFINVNKEGYRSPKLNLVESKNPMRKLTILGIISIIVIVASLIFLFLNSDNSNKSSHDNKTTYDEVFDKDPNTWTDNDKEYVNDLFEHVGK